MYNDWGFCIFVIFGSFWEKNVTSCRLKISSSWTFWASKLLLEVTSKEARMDKAWSTHIFGMFLEARLPFVIVHMQKITRKTYNYLLQTLFLFKSGPTMTSLPVTSPTFTMKMSMKMKFSNDKIYYNFSQKKPKITNM